MDNLKYDPIDLRRRADCCANLWANIVTACLSVNEDGLMMLSSTLHKPPTTRQEDLGNSGQSSARDSMCKISNHIALFFFLYRTSGGNYPHMLLFKDEAYVIWTLTFVIVFAGGPRGMLPVVNHAC